MSIDPTGEAPLCPPGYRGVPSPGYEDQYPDVWNCRPYPSNPPYCASNYDCYEDYLVCGLKKAHCSLSCNWRYSASGRGGAGNPNPWNKKWQECIQECEDKFPCRENFMRCTGK